MEKVYNLRGVINLRKMLENHSPFWTLAISNRKSWSVCYFFVDKLQLWTVTVGHFCSNSVRSCYESPRTNLPCIGSVQAARLIKETDSRTSSFNQKSMKNLKQLLSTLSGQNCIETVFFLFAQLKQWLCNLNWTKMWF